MSIQIIDNFQINKAIPIDSRIVASGSSERNAIVYKYTGLKVFDTSDNNTYVWYNSTWNLDAGGGGGGGGLSGTGTTGYLAQFTAPASLGDSLIWQDGTTVGIGGSPASSAAALDVTGLIKGTSLAGNGSAITNVGASNILGTLAYSNLPNGTNGNVLVAGTVQPSYKSPSTLSVGTASVASQVSTTGGAATSNYIAFVDSLTGPSTINIDTTLMYDASQGNLSTLGYSLRPSTPVLVFSALDSQMSKCYKTAQGYTSGFHNSTLGQIALLPNYSYLIETSCVARINNSDTHTDIQFFHLSVNGGGVITNHNAGSTLISSSDSGSNAINDLSIDVTNPNTVMFKQSHTKGTVYSYYSTLIAKVTIV